MKKTILLSLILSLILSINVSFAEESEIISINDEITDLGILYERATKGITDIEDNQKLLAKLVNEDNQKEENIETYSTTQKLKEIKYKSGKKEIQYVTTYFANIEHENFENTMKKASKVSILGSGDVGKTEIHSTTAFQATSRYYYSTITENNNEYIKVTKATGSWVRLDNTFSYSERTVAIGSSGAPYGGGVWATQNTLNTYNLPDTTLSFALLPPTSWKYVAEATGTYGVTTTIKIHRGYPVTTWTFVLENRVIH